MTKVRLVVAYDLEDCSIESLKEAVHEVDASHVGEKDAIAKENVMPSDVMSMFMMGDISRPSVLVMETWEEYA